MKIYIKRNQKYFRTKQARGKIEITMPVGNTRSGQSNIMATATALFYEIYCGHTLSFYRP